MKNYFASAGRLLAVALLAIAAVGCTQIDTGNVGVESSLGQYKKTVLPPGLYATVFKTVTEVSAKESVISLNDLKPQTSDKISLADLDIDIYVQIDPSKATDIITRWPGDIVKVAGEDGVRVGNNYVLRQAREAVYNAVTKFPSATVHTERTALAADIVASLQKDLDASAGQGWFFVRSANVRNLVTDPALEASIREAAKRDFEIAAKNKEVILAKAEADRQRAVAAGEADAIKLRASAIAANGGAEYVQLEAIKKWNGVLSQVQGASGGMILNLDSIKR
jgi:regulator of protease activity HflC (stomatin/prohibitin superfamily)